MSEGKAPVDPLARYVEDPNELKDFRKALEDADAIVQGLWTLSVFCDDLKPMLKRFSLSIVIHKDTDWTRIATVLGKNQYQLRADPKGLRFARQNRDDLFLILHREGDLDWKHENSLQKATMSRIRAQGLGCFMTSKYAVLFCPLDTPERVDMEEIRQSILSRYNARSGGSDAQRWADIDGTLICVAEVSDLAVTPDSFSWYLSSTPMSSWAPFSQ